MYDYNVNEFHDGPSTARTFVPLPSPGSDKYPYNKCTSTVVFGIAKNVKYPFEMTRPASSNDPKYLFETTEYHYRRPSKTPRTTSSSL